MSRLSQANPSQAQCLLVCVLQFAPVSLNACSYYPSYLSRALHVGVDVTIAVQQSMRRQYPTGYGSWMFQEHRITGERHCHRWPFGASFLDPM